MLPAPALTFPAQNQKWEGAISIGRSHSTRVPKEAKQIFLEWRGFQYAYRTSDLQYQRKRISLALVRNIPVENEFESVEFH